MPTRRDFLKALAATTCDGSVFPGDLKTLKDVGRHIREKGWP